MKQSSSGQDIKSQNLFLKYAFNTKTNVYNPYARSQQHIKLKIKPENIQMEQIDDKQILIRQEMQNKVLQQQQQFMERLQRPQTAQLIIDSPQKEQNVRIGDLIKHINKKLNENQDSKTNSASKWKAPQDNNLENDKKEIQDLPNQPYKVYQQRQRPKSHQILMNPTLIKQETQGVKQNDNTAKISNIDDMIKSYHISKQQNHQYMGLQKNHQKQKSFQMLSIRPDQIENKKQRVDFKPMIEKKSKVEKIQENSDENLDKGDDDNDNTNSIIIKESKQKRPQSSNNSRPSSANNFRFQRNFYNPYLKVKQGGEVIEDIMTKTSTQLRPSSVQSKDNLLFNSSFQLKNYTMGGIIGKGSYAIVRVGIRQSDDLKVAIKTYEKFKLQDQQKKKNLDREIHILKKLKHKYIIGFVELIETQRHINIVMEYVGQMSLRQYIRKQNQGYLQEHEVNLFIDHKEQYNLHQFRYKIDLKNMYRPYKNFELILFYSICYYFFMFYIRFKCIL